MKRRYEFSVNSNISDIDINLLYWASWNMRDDFVASSVVTGEHLIKLARLVQKGVVWGLSFSPATPKQAATWVKTLEEKCHDLQERVFELETTLFNLQSAKTVVEVCPHCEAEVEIRWSVKRDSFKAFCPYCGERLMLCDECLHRSGEFLDDCDYDTVTDSCRFSRGKNSGELQVCEYCLQAIESREGKQSGEFVWTDIDDPVASKCDWYGESGNEKLFIVQK